MTRRLVLAVAFAAACRPTLADRPSFVSDPRVLAVVVEPAEARPGEAVVVTVHAAGPEGPASRPQTSFSFCATPKPLTENGAVPAECHRDGVSPIGEGPSTIPAVLPPEGCFVFGPEIAAAELRPRDPDETGGFFQPIRADVAFAGGARETAFGFARLRCNPPRATSAAAAELRDAYRPNQNPRIGAISARNADRDVGWDALPRGARIDLVVRWREEDRERYVVLDETTQTLVARRESMRVSWFTTEGTLDLDRSGREEADRADFAENVLSTPTEARDLFLYVVLRDARGGSAFAAVPARVR